MPFNSIIGHDRQIEILKRALANDALAHAYLFSGEPGIGKRLTAFALAAVLNCEAPGAGGGCGACSACRRVAGGIHPDVRIVMPESRDGQLLVTLSTKEAEKASDEIKIDQVRRAQESISLKPSEGRKKVLIVDGAETMNEASQNAFLKTLEEPPGDSLIILITSLPRSLLPTIRSRCQELAFQPLPRHVLAAVIREKRGMSEEQFQALRAGLAGMQDDEIMSLADGIAADRAGFGRILDIGIERLRDRLVYLETGDERLLVFAGDSDGAEGSPKRSARERILQDMELFIQCRTFLERRVNPQLAAENLFLKLARS
jgi:DNA polymerase-3 subunit delta'